MFRKYGLVVLVAGAMASGAQAASWNLSNDFPTSANPSSAWLLGYSTSVGGTLTPLVRPYGEPTTSADTHFLGWGTPSGVPIVYKNISGSQYTTSWGQINTGDVMIHPGNSGELAVVRWTAPASGQYAINASFTRYDKRVCSASETVYVLKKGAQVMSGAVITYLEQKKYNDTVQLTAGDTLDFAVDYGTEKDASCDTVMLDVSITSGSTCDTTTPYNQGYSAAQAACKANPSACGITVSSSPTTTSGHATYNPTANTVHIPFLDVPTIFGGASSVYEIDLTLIPNTNPLQLKLQSAKQVQ